MRTKEKSTVPKTLTELEQDAAQALARVREAQAAADGIRQRAEQARIVAEQEHDRHVLEEWKADRDKLAADVVNARQQLRTALLDDPVWQAMRQLVLAGHRQTTRWMEAESAHNRVNGTQQSWGPVPHTEALPYEQLVRMVEDDAAAEGRDEAAAREQARVDAGQRAAEAETARPV